MASDLKIREATVALCWYCGEEGLTSSPEHVIPRALGGGLVVRVCPACNARANRQADEPLVRLPRIARERAKLGLRDDRTGLPVTFSEILDTDLGAKLRATWSPEGVTARFLPVEIRRPGTDVVDVFVDPSEADEHRRKQAARSAKRGLEVGPPLDPDHPETPSARYPKGSPVTFVATSRSRAYPPWVWPAATAKITLGCLAHGAALGLWPREGAAEITAHALRQLAFDHLYSPELWQADELFTLPARPSATHPLVGALARHEHLVALYAPEHRGQPPLAQLVLFGHMLLELPLPGLSIETSYAWLFSAKSRLVTHDVPENLGREAVSLRRSAHQMQMFI